jgi:hypothetical protein
VPKITAEQAKGFVGKKSILVEEDDSIADVMISIVEEMPLDLIFWKSDPELSPVF